MSKHRPETWAGHRELPPRPDSETGQPFPPHAPAYLRADTKPEDDPLRERRLSHKPSPPSGMGPVIAWHRENSIGNIYGYFISLAILIVGMSLITLADGDGIDWMSAWQVWLVLVVGAYLMSSPLEFTTLSAGADWLQVRIFHPFRRNRGGYIKLYELVQIEGTSSPTGYFLRIADRDGSSEMQIDQWQGDRRIWDLMYNGILHSIAGGAYINKHAIELLHIERTPALDIARQTGNLNAFTPTPRPRKGKHRPH